MTVEMLMASPRMPVTATPHLRGRVRRYSGINAVGHTAPRKARAITVELIQYATA